MRTSGIVILCVAMSMLLMACSTTKESRALAAHLKETLGQYRDDRDRAIQRVNASYRATYLSLMKRYGTVTEASLAVGRRTEARTAADEMLIDWETRSTLTAVLTSLESTRDREMRAIEARAAALADARKRYADSYAALELELDKIKAAQSKVADLAERDDARARTLGLLSKLAKAYREGQKSEGRKKQ